MGFSPQDLTLEDVVPVLAQADEDVKGLKILHAALAMGTLMFLGVTVFLGVTQWEQKAQVKNPPDMRPFAFANAGLAIVAWLLAATLPSKILRNKAALNADADSASAFAAMLLGPLKSTWIIQQALLEASALLGATCVMLAIVMGALRQQPLWALNAITSLVFLAESVLLFPSEHRLAKTIVRAAQGTRGLGSV